MSQALKVLTLLFTNPKRRKCLKLKSIFGGQESVGRAIAMSPIFMFLERCLDLIQIEAGRATLFVMYIFIFASKFFCVSEM